jgi:hypothetical protein
MLKRRCITRVASTGTGISVLPTLVSVPHHHVIVQYRALLSLQPQRNDSGHDLGNLISPDLQAAAKSGISMSSRRRSLHHLTKTVLDARHCFLSHSPEVLRTETSFRSDTGGATLPLLGWPLNFITSFHRKSPLPLSLLSHR